MPEILWNDGGYSKGRIGYLSREKLVFIATNKLKFAFQKFLIFHDFSNKNNCKILKNFKKNYYN